jgi:hypothetical protein
MRAPHVLSLALGLSIASPTLWLPSLWPSFVIPGIAAVALQTIALGAWKKKEFFFKIADYAYYLLIGGVAVLGSQLWLRAEEAKEVDAAVNIRNLENVVTSAHRTLPVLRAELESSLQRLASADRAFTTHCRTEQMLSQMRKVDQEKRNVAVIDPCLGFFTLERRASLLPSEIDEVERERAEAQERLERLKSRHPTAAVAKQPDPKATRVRAEVELRWVPLFILLGIAIKLGKTTCALFPPERAP